MLLAIAMLLLAPASDPCGWNVPVDRRADTVIAVRLVKNGPTDIKVIGADDVRRLHVAATVERIRKGTFDYDHGSYIGIAVHSIVQTFGDDWDGEWYDVALRRTRRGYRILSITPSPEFRFTLRLKVREKAGFTDMAVDFSALSTRPVPAVVESIDGRAMGLEKNQPVVVRLPISEETKLTPGQKICVLGVARFGHNPKPLRILRTVVRP